jgi:hypothetical protein
MGRIYAVPFSGTIASAGGNVDLWNFEPADDKPILLRGFELGQSSEVGDTAEEGLGITISRFTGAYTIGSGGAAVDENPMDGELAAAGFTSRTNDTTPTTGGTETILGKTAWNNRASPCEKWYPSSEFCPRAKQAQAIVIRLDTTPADDFTFSGTAYIEEL